MINYSDIYIQPATTKPTEKTTWGRDFRFGVGLRIKKTTLNKKTDRHSSLSGYNISFYSASIKQKKSN